jgi:short-subunit dehydrogenase
MGKSILITGASSGIGQALALEMAGRGYHLGLAARNLAALRTAEQAIAQRFPQTQVIVTEWDVTDFAGAPSLIRQTADAFGSLDIIFANAGIGLGGKIGRGEFEKARQTIMVNLLGAMATVDAAVARFLEQGRGHVVGTCSVTAFRGMPRNAAYSASKAGFANYLEALRAETYYKNIDVTVLYPGYIDTPLNQMLKKRPFVISVEKGAAIIAEIIEKKKKRSFVPVFPWNFIAALIKIAPTRMMAVK